MIIHEPMLSNENGRIVLSARIEMDTRLSNYPQTLWFSFPEEFTPFVSTRSDSFLASLMIPAMFFGEAIHVRGQVSPKLMYRLPEFQFYNKSARKKGLNLIEVNSPVLVPQPYDPKRGAIAVNFSGGVDSQFSFWSHLPQNQPVPEYQLTHALHIHGFDIRLRNLGYYQFIQERFAELFQEYKIELIPVSTNIFLFSEFRINWTISHSAALIGVALSLGNLIKTYIKPSAEPWGYQGPNTYHGGELSDPFLSTEQTEIIHHGNPYTRKEKLEYLYQFPRTYSTLRVCALPHRAEGKLNCSRCEKCLRTKILLKIKGYDDAFISFDQPFHYWQLFIWWIIAKKVLNELKRLVKYSIQEKDVLLAILLGLLILPGLVKDKMISFLIKIIGKNRLYRVKTRLFPSDTYDHDGNRLFDFL